MEKKVTKAQFTPNGICKQCHSTDDPVWVTPGAQDGGLGDLRDDKPACIDCHSDTRPTALHRRPGRASAEETRP